MHQCSEQPLQHQRYLVVNMILLEIYVENFGLAIGITEICDLNRLTSVVLGGYRLKDIVINQ